MNTPLNAGGPAFPNTKDSQSWDCHNPPTGMSLRDWFAGQALAGWLASYSENAQHPAELDQHGKNAEQAYMIADAMLAAREARK